MCTKYQYKLNLINDLFIETLLSTNDDISKLEIKKEMRTMLSKFLLQYVDEK